MKSKKNLQRAITLGLLLAGMSISNVSNATITSGTADINGTYVGVVADASSDITLNATGDVDFQMNYNDSSINNMKSGASIIVNMNNHNLKSEHAGQLEYIGGSAKKIAILNAYDINIFRDADNTLYNEGTGSEVRIEANHDFTIKNTLAGRPPVISEGKNTSYFIAGNNYTEETPANTAKILDGATLNLTAGNDVNLNSYGIAANFICAGTDTVSNITALNGNVNILCTTGNNTVGISADSGATTNIHAKKDVTIGGHTMRAVRAIGGTMNVTSDTGTIYMIANDAKSSVGSMNAAIYTAKSGTINGSVNLNSDAVLTAVNEGIQANNGSVNFAKKATITAPTAIDVLGGGKVTAVDAASAKKITGNIIADGSGSSADVNLLTSDSFLTGATTISNSGAINLEFGNGGVWNVTGDSSLKDLVNNSTVDMRYTGKAVNETLMPVNLSGNGTYIMNTDLLASYNAKDVQSNGDKIIITTSSTGNNILDLRDVSLDSKLQSQGYLLLVEDQSNGSAVFTGKDLAHGGIFKYKPIITTANPTDNTGFNASAKNWYLTGFERLIEVSDNTKATLGLSGTRYANYFMDQDTLLKRLGELRGLKGEPEQDGIWARYRHGGMEGSGFSGGSSMVQVGYDKKTSNKRYTGIAFNHTSNTYDFDGGASGDGSQDAVTVYNTWLGEKNHYFDIVGKLGKMRGYSTYKDSLYPEKGHYDSWYCSISGEYGRKNIDKNGWYYEPQAQLTLGRIRGNDYTTGLGTRVNMASITSLISRAGVTLGKEYNMKDANTHSNIYGKINWLHEFKGDVNTSLLDTYGDRYDHKKEYGGSWWNVGFGATINVNKNTHMYLDFEKNFGGEVTTNWIGQLGCQWTWK